MKKLVIGGAIAAVLLVAAVWAGLEWFLVEKNESFEKPVASNAPVPVPPSKSNLYRENVQRFLDGIAKSFRKRDHGRIADQFDLTQLYLHALGHDRSPDPPLPKLIGSQHSQLYSAVMDSFVRGGFGLPWDRIQIEQFLETPKGELVVNVLQISGDRVIPVWWWLVPTKNGYLITDAEDRLLGLSVSNQFSMLLNSGMSEERSGQVAEAVKCIPEIERLLDKRQPKEAIEILNCVKRTPLPAVQSATMLALEGLSFSALGDAVKAETIAASLGDTPVANLIRAASAGGDGWREKRWNAAGKYELVFGPTPLTISVRIQSLLSREKDAEAAEILEDGLWRFPDSPTLLAWSAVFQD